MFKTHYHYLIAGLPDLVFDDSKFPLTLKQFKDELAHDLSTADFELVRILFLPWDHRNLIRFLQESDGEHDPLGNFTVEDFEEQVSRLHAILDQKPLLPDYMVAFIRDFEDEEKEIPEESFEKILTEGYYRYAEQADNEFFRSWIAFERSAKNILATVIARKYGRDISGELIGKGPLVQELIASEKKGLEIRTENDHLDELLQLTGEEDFYERERKVDLLKWDYMDEHTFFHYFTIEKVIGYLVKLFLVMRWKELDRETGREMFERLIRDLESSWELSAEYSLNRR